MVQDSAERSKAKNQDVWVGKGGEVKVCGEEKKVS